MRHCTVGPVGSAGEDMSELSDKELLLLSNWVYVDRSTEYGTIGEMLDSCRNKDGEITAEMLSGFSIGGCMSAGDCAEIMREMDGCPENFRNLRAVRAIDAGGIRGVCYEDPSDSSKATVVFRGTGGEYDAWADNFRGEYMTETEMQKLADDFVRYDCGVYDELTVSGHSKGGNMAQYVAVRNRDRVNACVSFDGQGLGNKAIETYGYEAEEASPVIRSIAGDKDYVNILLNPVASERRFVNIDTKGMKGADMAVAFHSSYLLYKSCEFDGEGNIVNYAKQNILISGIADSLHRLVNALDMLPGNGNKRCTELIGSLVAAGMSENIGDENEKKRISEAAKGVRRYFGALSMLWMGESDNGVSVVTESLYVDTGKLQNCVMQLREAGQGVDETAGKVAEIRNRLNYKAASRLAVEIKLRKQENRLNDLAERIGNCADALDAVTYLYKVCEEKTCGEIAGTVFG